MAEQDHNVPESPQAGDIPARDLTAAPVALQPDPHATPPAAPDPDQANATPPASAPVPDTSDGQVN